jgi:hypothetical protein
MSAFRDFTQQYVIPRYGQGTAVDDPEAAHANGKVQPHDPDLEVAAFDSEPAAGPAPAAGPTPSNLRAPLPLPKDRGLVAIDIITNGIPPVVAPGGRLYLYPIGRFMQGDPEQLRGDLVTWKSDYPLNASVDDKGIVSGLIPGTADITVTEKSSRISSSALTITVQEPTPAGDATPKGKVPPELLKMYDKAKLDHQNLLKKAQEMDWARKALPPEKQIFEEIARNTSKQTTEGAETLRMRKEQAQAILGQIGILKTSLEFFKAQQEVTFEKIHAEELQEEAKELRERAEELKKATESAFKVLEKTLGIGLKVAGALAAPEFEIAEGIELIEAGVETVFMAAEGFHESVDHLLEQATLKEKEAHETQLKALKQEVQNLENARQKTQKDMAPTLQLLHKAAEETKTKAKNVQKDFDRGTKGKFKFTQLDKPLELASAIVKTLAPQARKSAESAWGAMYHWELTNPKGLLSPMKKDTLDWAREANVTAESAADILEDLAELQDSAHETMASAHDYDK